MLIVLLRLRFFRCFIVVCWIDGRFGGLQVGLTCSGCCFSGFGGLGGVWF